MFTKIDYYIDYNNSYSLKKTMTTLGREFNLAVNKNNIGHAKETINTLRKIKKKLHLTYKESQDKSETMSYSQKLFSRHIDDFILYLTQRLKKEFGVASNAEEIEQAIS